ncbi:MAG: DUF6263 family protein [Nocardioidaceae bacterium]
MRLRRTHRFALPLAVATAALTLTACGGDDSPEEGVQLADAGATGHTVELPPAPKVGHKTTGSYDMTISISMDSPSVDREVPMEMDYRSKIVKVGGDGSYTAETTISDITIVDPSGEMTDLAGVKDQFEDLGGVRYRQHFAEDGSSNPPEMVESAELTSTQLQTAHQFVDSIASTPATYPSKPVGKGATWEATKNVKKNGIELSVTTEYTLVKVTGDSFKLKLTQDVPIDTTVDSDGTDVDVSGDLQGSGTITGSLKNPLDTQVTLTEEVDMDLSADGSDSHMQMGIKMSGGAQ